MAKSGKPTRALQENVITLLCHSDEHGRLVAALVDPSLFEGDYSTIAGLAIDYWQRYGRAPKAQTGDLVADIIDAGGPKAQLYQEILRSMVELADSINAKYVTDQLRSFVRAQKIKRAIMESAEAISAQQEMAVAEVEQIWNKLLRERETYFERGMSLGEVDRVLDYLNNRSTEFSFGIPQFDDRWITPARAAVILMIAPYGRGKTWFLIHTCVMALLAGKKVLHISLEMGEEQCAQRYYQRLFGASKRNEESTITEIKINSLNKIDEFLRTVSPAEFMLMSPMARDELTVRISALGARVLDNLVIKRFAGMTIDNLLSYLDNLETSANFIPDMIGLDYWGLVNFGVSARDHRLGSGHSFIRFRDMLVERNIAGIVPHQINRVGAESTTTKSTKVAEDISLNFTADGVLTFSATATEQQYGLGRLYVDKWRDEKDKFGVLLTQNFDQGQFILSSHILNDQYLKMVPDLKKEMGNDDEAEDDSDEA